jgi:antitoxin component YwqK of YwqJK toxin-antitoxin module
MSTTFFQNGLKKNESNYLYNQKNGIERYYYRDGQLKIEGQYKLGKENGVFTYYFPDGSIETQIAWQNGVQIESKPEEKNVQ